MRPSGCSEKSEGGKGDLRKRRGERGRGVVGNTVKSSLI